RAQRRDRALPARGTGPAFGGGIAQRHDRVGAGARDRADVPAVSLIMRIVAVRSARKPDVLALPVREGAKLPDLLDGLVARVARDEEFTGKEGQLLSLHTHG